MLRRTSPPGGSRLTAGAPCKKHLFSRSRVRLSQAELEFSPGFIGFKNDTICKMLVVCVSDTRMPGYGDDGWSVASSVVGERTRVCGGLAVTLSGRETPPRRSADCGAHASNSNEPWTRPVASLPPWLLAGRGGSSQGLPEAGADDAGVLAAGPAWPLPWPRLTRGFRNFARRRERSEGTLGYRAQAWVLASAPRTSSPRLTPRPSDPVHQGHRVATYPVVTVTGGDGQRTLEPRGEMTSRNGVFTPFPSIIPLLLCCPSDNVKRVEVVSISRSWSPWDPPSTHCAGCWSSGGSSPASRWRPTSRSPARWRPATEADTGHQDTWQQPHTHVPRGTPWTLKWQGLVGNVRWVLSPDRMSWKARESARDAVAEPSGRGSDHRHFPTLRRPEARDQGRCGSGSA
ncbi:uncharacterized protein LOC125152201 [Prionailurus viverrinus]|uniref:uncharacterized protein LOC125152201 n=1 Tax=Prionailurus viverrinus TaxID=61388 RepID=UPI001FF57165|nr:uncharacterized protein LOC125152201 [Prionailurus viverrinus]